MRRLNLVLLVLPLIIILGVGCSPTKSNPSDGSATSKEKNHVIAVVGVPGEQAKSLAVAISQADQDFASLRVAEKYEAQGLHNQAIIEYEHAIEDPKSSFMARMALARLYERVGSYAKAAEYLEGALSEMAEWGKPEYEKKLSELKAKAARQP